MPAPVRLPRLAQSATAGLGIAIALSGSVGCAIDDRGSVRVTHRTSPTGRVVTLRSFGLHIHTCPLDRGVTLGATERSYFFPRQPAEGRSEPPRNLRRSGPGDRAALESEGGGSTGRRRENVFEVLADGALTPAEAVPMDSLGTPVGVTLSGTGVLLEASDHRVGLTIGRRDAALFRVDPRGDAAVAISAEGNHSWFFASHRQSPR